MKLFLVLLTTVHGLHQIQAQENPYPDMETAGGESVSKLRAGVFLGGNYLSSDNELGNSVFSDQVPNSGFLMGIRASYLVLDSIAPSGAVDPQLNIELEGKYTISFTDGLTDVRKSVYSPVVGWRAHLLLDLFSAQKIVPFVMLGVGGETVVGANTYMSSPDTDIASYVGGGARIRLNRSLDLRGDFRFGLTAARSDGLSELAELHLGLAYNFGASPRASANRPPPVAVEPDLSNRGGISESDSDNDGVLDTDDLCPSSPENINGIEDEDGCPEEDLDYDGKLGSEDRCPEEAEDVDGFEDDDGCPDADNDGDGLADEVDSCPTDAETKNGFEDADGCPDEVPSEVQKFTGTIKGIQFESGSAQIRASSRSTLLEAFKILSDNPSVRIEVSGHSDNRGNDERNRKLSRKRADYVKWFLVDHGIAADRIETVGHGSDIAIGDNKHAEGRKLNRRIEFRLLPTVDNGAVPASPAPKAVPASPAPKAVPASPAPKAAVDSPPKASTSSETKK